MANPSPTPRGTLQIRPLHDMTVRLARTHEWPAWSRLMKEHHYLGFKQFVGCGLRYVAEWRGQWVALAGWQTGVFQGKPLDPPLPARRVGGGTRRSRRAPAGPETGTLGPPRSGNRL